MLRLLQINACLVIWLHVNVMLIAVIIAQFPTLIVSTIF